MKNTRKDIDKQIGATLKMYRTMCGISQSNLAKGTTRVSFQQIQKYEKGLNRLSLTDVLLFCEYMNISMINFIDSIGTHDLELDSRNKQDVIHFNEFKNLPVNVQNKLTSLVNAVNKSQNRSR